MSKEYKIHTNDDWVTPEETLLDASSDFSNLEQPISQSVFSFSLWISVVLSVVVLLTTARLAIAEHSRFSALALQNSSPNLLIPPPRGIIYDSSGNPLVTNIPIFDLVGITKEINPLLNDSNTLTNVATALGISSDDLQNTLKTQSQTASVFVVANDLTKDQVLMIDTLQPVGLHVIPDAERSYINGPMFSSVVGYVGKVNKDDLTDDSYYNTTDTIGRLGIEQQYEQYLRGQHGRVFFGAQAPDQNIDTQAGDGVVLNINSNIQQMLWQTMDTVLAQAGLSRGAAVIQNPQTGAVLAMVSFPSYDNNTIVGGLSTQEYNSIFNNPARPLFNRVISGTYNPGSTIKPLMGLMGLQEGVITPQTTIQDCIAITIPNPYNPNDPYVFKNWREDHGAFDLRRSIANSCNVFFASVGGGYGDIKGLGVDRIVSYLQKVNADKKTGIDLPGEDPGFVPTPTWFQAVHGQQWYQGDTYNISIGQGDLNVTPIWINSILSAIANGGTVYQPQVAHEIVSPDKNPIQTFTPQVVEQLPFSDTNLATVKSDMQETVLSGTATLLKDVGVPVGAKTGTAEVVKGQTINSVFTVFAPLDNPQLAMTVLIEGASSSNEGYAIVTANDVLKWYFANNK